MHHFANAELVDMHFVYGLAKKKFKFHSTIEWRSASNQIQAPAAVTGPTRTTVWQVIHGASFSPSRNPLTAAVRDVSHFHIGF
ncbi:hypothetical protein CEXT_336611 [Caerostris extrusa]|uniref:Uncharacterized protein n=1 Tax=Caerostris extrusa TaxID=172846 RepID=A0AAV4Y0F4_CAEEX|nr:hypothetical protein CEXT_336611 [Caerostris extrusa]